MPRRGHRTPQQRRETCPATGTTDTLLPGHRWAAASSPAGPLALTLQCAAQPPGVCLPTALTAVGVLHGVWLPGSESLHLHPKIFPHKVGAPTVPSATRKPASQSQAVLHLLADLRAREQVFTFICKPEEWKRGACSRAGSHSHNVRGSLQSGDHFIICTVNTFSKSIVQL